MNFRDSIKQRARQNIKTIVLPEASDLRIIKAAATAIQEKYANIVLVGDEDSIKAMANENNLNINEAKIVNPLKSEKSEVYANKLYEYFIKKCEEENIRVEHGIFGADMKVELLNDGPVTIVLEVGS